jgi:hypothetical protein
MSRTPSRRHSRFFLFFFCNDTELDTIKVPLAFITWGRQDEVLFLFPLYGGFWGIGDQGGLDRWLRPRGRDLDFFCPA